MFQLVTFGKSTLFLKTFAATLLILYLLLLVLREFNYSSRSKCVVKALIIENTWKGSCGNIDYEIHTTDNSDAVSSNSSINKKISTFNIEQQQLYKHAKYRHLSKTNKFNRVEAEEKLKNELVKVRLNVVYDSSFAEEFPQREKLENYVRNIIFSAQIILNQEEISKHVRINLVVVNLKESTQSFGERMQSREILKSFSKGSDVDYSEADLNLLMTFRNLWEFLEGRRVIRFFDTKNYDLLENIKMIGTNNERAQKREPKSRLKILGQAAMDTFCHKRLDDDKVLILNAPSLGSSVVLAHELAHSFGVDHDGTGSSKNCTTAEYIMYPAMAEGRLRWSQCSVKKIVENFIGRIDCLFDPIRVNKSVPFKPLFDFSQANIPLPGKEISIDAQCAQALGEIATSSLNTFGRNGNSKYETCQSLVCNVGRFMEVAIGPAPAGSQCTLNGGYCSHGSCIKSWKAEFKGENFESLF